MIIIDSRSFLNGILLVLDVLFRMLLHPFVILTGVNGGVCAAASWSVLHRNEARINNGHSFCRSDIWSWNLYIFCALWWFFGILIWKFSCRKGKTNTLFFLSGDQVERRNGNMHKYCRKHLQAFTAFRNLGLKTWTLSLQSKYHQSSLTKCITQIEHSIIASLLCPHRVNAILFLSCLFSGHFQWHVRVTAASFIIQEHKSRGRLQPSP